MGLTRYWVQDSDRLPDNETQPYLVNLKAVYLAADVDERLRELEALMPYDVKSLQAKLRALLAELDSLKTENERLKYDKG